MVDFCSQNFGGSNPYISAGGGAGASGGWSGAEPCTSGQYSFSQDGTWSISMDAPQAQGKVPYRVSRTATAGVAMGLFHSHFPSRLLLGWNRLVPM